MLQLPQAIFGKLRIQGPLGFQYLNIMDHLQLGQLLWILIILKYFELDVFLSSENALKHDPR